MEKFYTVDIAGRKEDLPIIKISDTLSIAFLNLHGNTELTEYCGKKIADLIRGEVDIVLTAESKGLQLSHCVSRELSHKFYAVARKSRKLYMQDGISSTAQSITTQGVQNLFLSASDAKLLKGKRVAIVDDVISTGGSILGLESLVEIAGGIIAKKVAVLAEGEAANRKDIEFLGSIPLL